METTTQSMLKEIVDALTSAEDPCLEPLVLSEETGIDLDTLKVTLGEMKAEGYIELDDDLMTYLTAKGYRAAYGHSFESESIIEDLGLR